METLVAALNIGGGGFSVNQTVTTTDNARTNLSPTIPATTNDYEIDVGSIVKANVKALFLMAQYTAGNLPQATAPVVVYVNQAGSPGSGSPDQTWDLTPNVFGYWDHQSPFANPISPSTITKLYVNNPNPVPCVLVFQTIEHVTIP